MCKLIEFFGLSNVYSPILIHTGQHRRARDRRRISLVQDIVQDKVVRASAWFTSSCQITSSGATQLVKSEEDFAHKVQEEQLP